MEEQLAKRQTTMDQVAEDQMTEDEGSGTEGESGAPLPRRSGRIRKPPSRVYEPDPNIQFDDDLSVDEDLDAILEESDDEDFSIESEEEEAGDGDYVYDDMVVPDDAPIEYMSDSDDEEGCYATSDCYTSEEEGEEEEEGES